MGSSCRLTRTLLSLLFLFINTSSLHAITTTDTLTVGQSLTDGQTLVSPGKVFELGFFSPVDTTNRYVGIWYYDMPDPPVVWVANRETPIPDTSGIFTLLSNGSLAVLDVHRTIIWSSNTSIASNNSQASIMDVGNFAVNASGSIVWQSFDHPTDTFLPGMRVGLDLRTNVNTVFRSWKSATDPSPGRYSYGADPRRIAQVMIWDGSAPRWRSGQWNGQAFTGVANMKPLNLYGFKFSDVQVEQKMYFMYIVYNATYVRFVMKPNGINEQHNWNEKTRAWTMVWAQPVTDCEVYNKCGNNGICSPNDATMCSCLRGFVPMSELEWKSGNWSGGCVRRTELECGRNRNSSSSSDGFLEMNGVKIPDVSDWIGDVDLGGCEEVCLRNCSCKAYAFIDGIGCMVWGTDLIDMQQFASSGNRMFIRLAGSELGEEQNKHSSIIVIVGAILGSIFTIACVCILWKCKNNIRGLWREDGEQRMLFQLDASDEEKQGKHPELTLFSFESVAVATNNFNESNALGQGGFGTVYEGRLLGGQKIAVKRLSKGSGQGLEEFKNEVILIARLQHRNLVRLLGCCIQGEEKILVYEYLPNKSLDAFLFDPTKRAALDWKTRFSVIEGIARGLLYLHRDSRLRIVHRDLKASNILLDEEMNPKISDFGMARIFGGNQNQANTNRVVGTYGYMSPEYAMDGLFSVKSDVYSFGVLLLEIISGKKNKVYLLSGPSVNLLGYAWKLLNDHNAKEFVDPSIRDSCCLEEVLRCIHVGLLCVQDRANDRPTMASVVLMLGSEAATYPIPKQPTFTADRSHAETSSSMGTSDEFSHNEISVTVVLGR